MMSMAETVVATSEVTAAPDWMTAKWWLSGTTLQGPVGGVK